MQAWQILGGFGLERLECKELSGSQLLPGQVRLRIKAVSLNYRDLMMVRGEYNPRQPLPLVPCSDGVGEVVEVGPPDGSGVPAGFKVGDRVSAAFSQTWLAGKPTREGGRGALGGPLDGMLRTEAVLSASGLVRVPAFLSDVEAATLPCAGVTAFCALMQQPLEPGMTVLTQGTGGVSLFALQLAKLWGARVIVTSKSDEKLERARALGADEVINYVSEPEWGKKVKALTQNLGADHVIEVGGGGTLGQSLKAVKVGGHVSVIGVLSGSSTTTALTPILMQNVRLQGVMVGSKQSFEDLNRLVELKKLKPVVDRIFPFAEARQAFEYLASGAHFGKVCIAL